jgi:hypothetical protein
MFGNHSTLAATVGPTNEEGDASSPDTFTRSGQHQQQQNSNDDNDVKYNFVIATEGYSEDDTPQSPKETELASADVDVEDCRKGILRNGGENYMTPTCQKESRRAARRESRREKDRFLVFTRVLMKYLEQTDEVMHSEVREVIRDCTERKARKEPGYENVTTILKRRIQEIVNEECWHRAELYLERFLKEKAMIRSSSFQSRRGSMSSQPSRRGSMSSQQSRRGSMSSRHTVETVETEDSTYSMTSSIMHDPTDTTVSYCNYTHHSSSSLSSNCPPTPSSMYPQRRASACAGGGPASAIAMAAYEKEQFVLLMRALMKVLQENDPDGLHPHVQVIVQDCTARHHRNEPGYESITATVRERLEIVIPPEYWQQAHIIFREQQQQQYAHHHQYAGGWRVSRRSSI